MKEIMLPDYTLDTSYNDHDHQPSLFGIEQPEWLIKTTKIVSIAFSLKTKLTIQPFLLGLWFVLYLFCFMLWTYSNINCSGNIIKCMLRMQNYFVQIGFSVYLMAFSIFTIFVSSIWSRNSLSTYIGILSLLVYYSSIAVRSTGFTWEDHSQGNFIILNIFLLYISISYIIFRIYQKIYYCNKIAFRILAGVTVIAIIYLYDKRILKSCSKFNDGLLPNYTLKKGNGECNWDEASICWHFVIYGMFRPLYWGRDTCKGTISDQSLVRQSVNAESLKGLVISVPNMSEMTRKVWTHYELFQQANYDMMEIIDPKDIDDSPREVFFDFRKDHIQGETIIKLRDLSSMNKFSEVDFEHPNIVNIFIDTISRQRFHRRFHRTKQFLKKNHFSKDGSNLAYEFFRCHSDRGYTSPNLFSQTYGFYDGIYTSSYHKRVEHFAYEQGYVSGIFNNYCQALEVDIKKAYSVSYPDDFKPHHNFYQIGCNENVTPRVNPFSFGMGKGPYTVRMNCFQQKETINFGFDYFKQFFRTYSGKRKYFQFRVIDGHEFTGELSEIVIDKWVRKMFDFLENENFLKNTIVRLFSDHGDHVNPIGYKTVSGKVERFNPMFFQMIPKKYKETYGKYMEGNVQKLIHHKDFFVADLGVMGIKENPFKSKGGLNYMETEIPTGRTCKDIKLYDPVKLCYCHGKGEKENFKNK